MRQHAADDAPEDLRGRAVVEGTVAGVGVRALAQEGQILELVAVQGAADVDALAADRNDLLSRQELLGDGRGQTTQQVSSAVNNHLLLEHFWFFFESLVRLPTLGGVQLHPHFHIPHPFSNPLQHHSHTRIAIQRRISSKKSTPQKKHLLVSLPSFLLSPPHSFTSPCSLLSYLLLLLSLSYPPLASLPLPRPFFSLFSSLLLPPRFILSPPPHLPLLPLYFFLFFLYSSHSSSGLSSQLRISTLCVFSFSSSFFRPLSRSFASIPS